MFFGHRPARAKGGRDHLRIRRERSEQVVDLPDKILFATDGSEDANLAARAAVDLSDRVGAELHVAHVLRDARPENFLVGGEDRDSRADEWRESEAREFLEGQAERLRGAGASAVVTHLRRGRPAEEIVGLAGDLGVGLVVVGSRGLGAVKRLVVGSVSEGVVSLARCPVLVVRGDEGAWPPARIVVGADTSDEAREAAGLAVNLRDPLGVEVLLVLAYERRMVTPLGMRDPRPSMEARRASNRAWEALSRLSAELETTRGSRPKTRAVLGDAAAVLQETAEEGEAPTLVAVGSRGLNAAQRAALGSVSAAVLRSAEGPVLIVPPPKDDRADVR
jgi:nucleotide-binding universal stress UspA family protein